MNKQERDELVNYRITKAKGTFKEVKLHIENKLWNTAINRLYYSCYYAVIALLIDRKIQTQTHNGVRQMFGLHFIKTGIIDNESGKLFSDLFDMRQTSDYDDYINFQEEDVIDLIEPANLLILQIEKLLGKQ